jgi:hypothetical protein
MDWACSKSGLVFVLLIFFILLGSNWTELATLLYLARQGGQISFFRMLRIQNSLARSFAHCSGPEINVFVL